jgi:holo-[acyl-carrier protein] synthase
MAQGVGIDIIEIERIAQVISRHGQRFLDRIFTAKEQRYCLDHVKSTERFAARFAAKEAVVKAFGTGFRDGISWHDIEIVNDAVGKPTVVLSSRLLDLVGGAEILLSMSHCREYATAVAILQ